MLEGKPANRPQRHDPNEYRRAGERLRAPTHARTGFVERLVGKRVIKLVVGINDLRIVHSCTSFPQLIDRGYAHYVEPGGNHCLHSANQRHASPGQFLIFGDHEP